MMRLKTLPRASAFRAATRIALLLALALAAPALAHDAASPIDGDAIAIDTSGASSSWSFHFDVSGEGGIGLGHDPSTDGFSLLVRGTGDAGGNDAGRTSLIDLDPGFWSTTTSPAGFAYTDANGSRGGVTAATLQSGAVSIDASGSNWEWDIDGDQENVWVQFWIEDESFCSNFSATTGASITQNANNHFEATGASAPGDCPSLVCGNGIHELGEDCDDGNLVDSDGCSAECVETTCQNPDYPTTWEALEELVFRNHACDTCHTGNAPAGGLDLSPGTVYENIVGVRSNNFANEEFYILPGEPSESYLIRKLVAATPHGASLKPGEGSAMPPGYFPEELLEAFEIWVRAGAPNSDSESAVVDETAELLSVCLPPATPLKVEPPDRPTPGTGVQFVQPPWDLPPSGEGEICMATYYDLTQNPGLVPEEFQVDCPDFFGAANPSDKCFVYNRELLVQDAQSHHSIIHLYTGVYPVDYAGSGLRQFGPFTYKEPTIEVLPGFPPAVIQHEAGDACDPKDVAYGLGYKRACAGKIVSTIACISALATRFGPPDYSAGGVTGAGGGTAPAFSGSQESYYDNVFHPGVYSLLPMQGVIVWNSHAFNLTGTPSTMEQYLNIYFAGVENRQHQVAGIFDAHDIFAQSAEPYTTEELCATFTLPRNSHLFRLNSHTHRWGVKFRIWEPPNRPCLVDNRAYQIDPSCEPGEPDQLVYVSTEYTDPVNLFFETPKFYDSENVEDRTLLFCSEYDNGSKVGSPSVKRQSTSPWGPFGRASPGGPCADAALYCYGGTNPGTLCRGNESICEGGGECDACPLAGGVTTEDEMFIALGSYYVSEEAPEPELTEEEQAAIARAEELCSVAKAKAASRDVGCRMRHSLRAARRGSIADVSTCGTRLASAYDRAEGRYLSCADADTATEQGAENQRFVDQRLAAAGVDTSGEPNSGGSAFSARCASQTARAIASHYRCEGQALRQEIRGRLATANRLRDRCATRIERALDRVQRRYRDACTETPDVARVIAANRLGAAAAASSD